MRKVDLLVGAWFVLLSIACTGNLRVHRMTPQLVHPPPALRTPSILRIEGLQILRETHRGRTKQECVEAPVLSSEPWVSLYEDGLLACEGRPIGKLLSDGSFVDLRGIEQVSMNADGRVEADGVVVTISADGTTIEEFEGIQPRVRRPANDGSLGFNSFVQVDDADGGTTVHCTRHRIEPFTPGLIRTALFAALVADVVRSHEARRAWELE